MRQGDSDSTWHCGRVKSSLVFWIFNKQSWTGVRPQHPLLRSQHAARFEGIELSSSTEGCSSLQMWGTVMITMSENGPEATGMREQVVAWNVVTWNNFRAWRRPQLHGLAWKGVLPKSTPIQYVNMATISSIWIETGPRDRCYACYTSIAARIEVTASALNLYGCL